MKSKVYFTKNITPEAVVKLYDALDINLKGKVAAKVHSGEEGNQNYITPDFFKPMIDYVNGTVVETNTAYGGERNTTKKHKALMERHGWTKFFPVDLLDAEGPDLKLDFPEGKVLKSNLVGKDTANYDSLLVLTHFKGHPMGGYGGALKQLSIGCASSSGKCLIHSGGKVDNQRIIWGHTAPQDVFCEAMADAAGSVVKFFNGNAAYINVMKNISVDCDCCEIAEDPCMADIGMLASLDPVAVDQACIDLVYSSDDNGKKQLIRRIERQHGIHTIEAAADLGVGQREYDLIEIE